MDIATITQIVGGFQKLVGETLADLKRAEFATIDIDLLRLKRDTLRECLQDLEKGLAAAAER